MGEMRDSDWSRPILLRSDWSGPSVAMCTTHGKPKEYGFLTPARVKCSFQVSGYFQLNFERTLEIGEVKSLNGHLSG